MNQVARIWMAIAAGCLLTAAALATPAQAQPPQTEEPARPRLEKLKSIFEAARNRLTPVAGGRLQQARERLKQSIARLETVLSRSGSDGESWRKYLAIDTLKQSIEPEAQANPVIFSLVQVRFNAKHAGLEESEFVDVANDLRQFRELNRAATAAPTADDLRKQLDPIQTLADGKGRWTPEEFQLISDALGVIDATDSAPELVTAVREQFSRPNFFAQVSESFMTDGVRKVVDDRTTTCECVNGAMIYNRTHTLGNVDSRFEPSDEHGILFTSMDGMANTSSTARKGPAIVNAKATTKLFGQLYLTFDEYGLHRSTHDATAKTSIRFTGFGSTKRGIVGKIVTRIAAKKAPEQRRQSERTADRKAVQRLTQKLADQSDEMIAKANNNYDEKVRLPLVRLNAFPQQFDVSTTEDELRVVLKHDDRFHLGAPNDPPVPASGSDVAFRMHESFFNNMAHSLYAARTVTQEDFDSVMRKNDGEVPDQLKPLSGNNAEQDEDLKKPWSVTFAEREPVTLRLEDNIATLVIRGRQYTSGDAKYEAMNITVRYRFETGERSVVALRQGEIETLPPDFKAGQTLSPKQTVLSRLIRKRLGRVLEERMELKPIDLQGKFASAGDLYPRQWTIASGWLTVGLKADKRPDQDKVAGAE